MLVLAKSLVNGITTRHWHQDNRRARALSLSMPITAAPE